MKPIIPSTFPKTFVIKSLEKHRSSLAVSLCLYYFCTHGCRRTRIHSPQQPWQTECHVSPPNPYSAHIPLQDPSASGPDCHLRYRQDPMNALPPRATMKRAAVRPFRNITTRHTASLFYSACVPFPLTWFRKHTYITELFALVLFLSGYRQYSTTGNKQYEVSRL